MPDEWQPNGCRSDLERRQVHAPNPHPHRTIACKCRYAVLSACLGLPTDASLSTYLALTTD
eukprot:2217454-Alexandrium_andersonii.AAC.1